MKQIKKKINKAFRKEIYLLGIDQDGLNVWLEAPSFDCGWYWVFGYIERYTNNRNPHLSRDILSHSHFKGEIVGDFEGNYIHHINENPNFKATTLNDSESWELSELMKQARILSDVAGLYHSGSAGVSSNKQINLKNLKEWKKINEVLLPKIFKRIEEIFKSEVKK